MEKRYQVFVSSTYTGLIRERQEVMRVLLESDCIPSGMELFRAALSLLDHLSHATRQGRGRFHPQEAVVAPRGMYILPGQQMQAANRHDLRGLFDLLRQRLGPEK
ncbi:MAG: DUF4062 domain-containing protein [Magnetococcales bacterium]|nr:DUF4062 domain-containing protein [Magnetococcales bacterium]